MSTAELNRDQCLMAIDRALRATLPSNPKIPTLRNEDWKRVHDMGALFQASKATNVQVNVDDFRLIWRWWE